jgi:signal transduction histidine kinase
MFTTSFKCEDSLNDVPDEKIIILFRIVQEALGNIIKHAQASHIHIEIKTQQDGFKRICIADNGKGFSDDGSTNGIGLRNMHHRGKMIGASINIEKNNFGGTSVIISIN